MAMDLKDSKIDVDRLNNGGWVNEIPGMEGFRVKTRGDENPEYRKKMSILIDMLPRKKKLGGRIDPIEQDRIIGTCLLETCLLDWDGLIEDGKPVPFDKALAKEMMHDPAYGRFRRAFAHAASVVAETTDGEIKEDAGN
jgi:hypothetical protein